MNEIMLEEINDQPDALKRSLPVLRDQLSLVNIDFNKIKRVIFAGSGDSYIAAVSLAYAARKYTGKEVYVLPAQEALSYWSYSKEDLLVPTSISGETKRTILAARKAIDDGAKILPITTNPLSSLGNVCHEKLIIPVKSRTRVTPHTTDYITTLLAIACIIEKIHGIEINVLNNLHEIVGTSLSILIDQCTQLGQSLSKQDKFYFFGSGPNFGTCLYGAILFWEARGMLAIPSELDEVGHGLLLALEQGDVIFLPTTTGNTQKRILESIKGLNLLKVKILVISDDPMNYKNNNIFIIPKIAEEWSPFLTCLPIQLVCWAISTSKGYDVLKDGRFADKETYNSILSYMRSE